MTSDVFKIIVKEIGWFLFATALTFLIAIFFILFLEIGNSVFSLNEITGLNEETFPFPYLAALFAQFLAFFICSIWRRRIEGEKLTEWKNNVSSNLSLFKKIGLGILTAIILLVIVYLEEIILYVILDESILADSRWSEISQYSTPAKLSFLFIGAFLAPIVEELYFREVMLGSIHRIGFPSFAMFFSCAVFGIIHFNFMHIFAYLIYGIGFSLVYIKTRSLVPSITAHILINLILLTLLLFS